MLSKRKTKNRFLTRKNKVGFLLTLPSLVVVFLFIIYPIIDLLRQSFIDFSPLRTSSMQFVGFNNYVWMLTSDTSWHSILVTLKFTLGSVLLELIIGLGLSLLLSRIILEQKSVSSKTFVNLANGIFILPFAAPGIVAAIAWKMLLHPQFSPINSLLGIDIAWFTEYPVLSIIVADSWKMTPMVIFLCLSALLSIDESQFEAARIDGTNIFQRFFHLTLPEIVPVLTVTCAFRAVDAFTKVFDIVFGTTGGGPGNATQVFPLLIWQTAFNNLNFGKAAALSIFGILISILLGKLVLSLGRRR